MGLGLCSQRLRNKLHENLVVAGKERVRLEKAN